MSSFALFRSNSVIAIIRPASVRSLKFEAKIMSLQASYHNIKYLLDCRTLRKVSEYPQKPYQSDWPSRTSGVVFIYLK